MDGIIYSAAGESYVAEALAAARSSLRHNPVPHVVFASPVPSNEDPESRLSIEPFEPSGNPYVDKIANMRRSPFERTFYLDTDTYVLGDITHVFEVLDRYDIAAAYAPRYRRLADRGVPIAFCELNTGVVAWRAGDRGAGFLQSWQDTYAAWQREPPFPLSGETGGRADQPAFRHCAWQHGMQVLVLPPEYNYRTGVPGTITGRVWVIHGRQDDYEAMGAKLNAAVEAKPWAPRSFPGMERTGAPRPPSD